jgi:hypothetical protein
MHTKFSEEEIEKGLFSTVDLVNCINDLYDVIESMQEQIATIQANTAK